VSVKVGDLLRKLADDGWYLVATEGDHRQYKHPTKPGRVTVAGRPSKDIPPGTLNKHSASGWARSAKGEIAMHYLIVVEKGDRDYGAYAPDLPGCIAVGDTPEETERLMRDAIELHLRGLREDGLPIPEPVTTADYVELA
jgi:predicted RNase H-like HicB family nuclease/predicted RNA binding protein YcfA (HicA-like mRNA interferase family)